MPDPLRCWAHATLPLLILAQTLVDRQGPSSIPALTEATLRSPEAPKLPTTNAMSISGEAHWLSTQTARMPAGRTAGRLAGDVPDRRGGTAETPHRPAPGQGQRRLLQASVPDACAGDDQGSAVCRAAGHALRKGAPRKAPSQDQKMLRQLGIGSRVSSPPAGGARAMAAAAAQSQRDL